MSKYVLLLSLHCFLLEAGKQTLVRNSRALAPIVEQKEEKLRTGVPLFVTTTRGNPKKQNFVKVSQGALVDITKTGVPSGVTVRRKKPVVLPEQKVLPVEKVELPVNVSLAELSVTETTTDVVKIVPAQQNIVSLSTQKAPQKTIQRRVATPVKRQKRAWPVHKAILFASAINTGDHAMAYNLLPHLKHYGPAVLLQTMIKNPGFIERLADKYYIQENIHQVKLRQTADYIAKILEQKKLQDNKTTQ